VTDRGLVAIAQRFLGAWPYLSLIAAANARDPLDADVVEAYWVGNRLLDNVPGSLLAAPSPPPIECQPEYAQFRIANE